MLRLTPPDDAIPFIVTTPARQSVEEKRKLIRSHVMRGKNRKKRPLRPPSWIGGGKVNDAVNIRRQNVLSTPAKVGGELSFTAFSAEMGSDMLETIWKLQQAMFPVGFGLAFGYTEPSWFEPIWNDAACLHFTVFIAKAYLDFVHRQKEISATALAHLVKALTILQQRLASSDDELSTSDSTILVVVDLTMAATVRGDLDTALKHLQGLHKMVILRGGLSAFTGNRQLQTKIADLGVALGTGCQPLFFSDGILWDSRIASPGRIPISGTQDPDPDPQMPTSDLGPFFDSLDTRLRLVWDDISELVRATNMATQCKLYIDKELYQEVMISTHYRLVHLRFVTGDVNETTRLGLLAFASTLFLQSRGVKTQYEYLAQCLQNAISLLGHKTRAIPTQLTLWLHIVGAVSVFGEHEQAWFRPALTELLQAMRLASWKDVSKADSGSYATRALDIEGTETYLSPRRDLTIKSYNDDGSRTVLRVMCPDPRAADVRDGRNMRELRKPLSTTV
ncbi:uncharacterized protein Z518_07420 [Rhinocladiella mackenziei CBS 650.93]|uniref:Uncharacterized protein n=1 Tax=Rhinocladiella mackenziei CBS 650.93 TaxID=1442369 RepID=A0A0D2FP13_9EURO|nr:uncharacterized protein Z518_07420 [Rhinocladiella mackenziei CBS 650.93]KIX03867.1 hypothetical protein Z518_07420 [Rhinocladiella mackenziei CBS 650.93]